MENRMSLSLLDSRGCPLDAQKFSWRDLVQKPISKLDDDAFTRVRVILMNGIELEASRFSAHGRARMNRANCRLPLGNRSGASSSTRRRWSTGCSVADHSPLETTIGYEQVAIESHCGRGAARARSVPGAGLYRFGLLEDFDHHATGIRRCSTGSKARTPTTSCSATPTSCRDARLLVQHRAPAG
jgi:hypothetical protein